MPGESPAIFGDALRRLAAAATYLYQDGAALLVFDAADGHQAGRGPRRAAEARSRQGGAGAGQAAARRPAQDGRLPPRPSHAAVGPGRARRPRRPARGLAASITPTARSRATPPRRPPRRSSSRAATRRVSTATRSSSSRLTRPDCRTSTRPCGAISPGSRSSPRK